MSEPICPRCESTAIQPLLPEAGGSPPDGLLMRCRQCGAQWVAGSRAEWRMRALGGQLGDSQKVLAQREVARERRRQRAVTWSVLLAIVALGLLLGLVILPRVVLPP